jgi:DNA repair protein RecN (Recombination protein N)
MKESRFSIAVEPSIGEDGQPTPSPTGLDQVEFLIAPNPGEPPKPVRKIASGGELSRVMLALKSVLALADRISVLVFDEIDANVGGRLGSVIGRKLSDLAAHHQVLCITHLPQIASFADSQLTVRKQSRQGRSFTVVEPVTGDRRIAELAEMIGGKDVTETTRQQARELLALAKK